jgi:hypothetical protein
MFGRHGDHALDVEESIPANTTRIRLSAQLRCIQERAIRNGHTRPGEEECNCALKLLIDDPLIHDMMLHIPRVFIRLNPILW